MSLQEIESAITHLNSAQLTQFRGWYESFDTKLWDKQFEQDAKNGKLDSIASKALKDFKAGSCKKL